MNNCQNCGQVKEGLQIVVQDPLCRECRKAFAAGEMALIDTRDLLNMVDLEQAIRFASVAIAE